MSSVRRVRFMPGLVTMVAEYSYENPTPRGTEADRGGGGSRAAGSLQSEEPMREEEDTLSVEFLPPGGPWPVVYRPELPPILLKNRWRAPKQSVQDDSMKDTLKVTKSILKTREPPRNPRKTDREGTKTHVRAWQTTPGQSTGGFEAEANLVTAFVPSVESEGAQPCAAPLDSPTAPPTSPASPPRSPANVQSPGRANSAGSLCRINLQGHGTSNNALQSKIYSQECPAMVAPRLVFSRSTDDRVLEDSNDLRMIEGTVELLHEEITQHLQSGTGQNGTKAAIPAKQYKWLRLRLPETTGAKQDVGSRGCRERKKPSGRGDKTRFPSVPPCKHTWGAASRRRKVRTPNPGASVDGRSGHRHWASSCSPHRAGPLEAAKSPAFTSAGIGKMPHTKFLSWCHSVLGPSRSSAIATRHHYLPPTCTACAGTPNKVSSLTARGSQSRGPVRSNTKSPMVRQTLSAGSVPFSHTSGRTTSRAKKETSVGNPSACRPWFTRPSTMESHRYLW